MATFTTNFNLRKPDAASDFVNVDTDINDNMDIIDTELKVNADLAATHETRLDTIEDFTYNNSIQDYWRSDTTIVIPQNIPSGSNEVITWVEGSAKTGGAITYSAGEITAGSLGLFYVIAHGEFDNMVNGDMVTIAIEKWTGLAWDVVAVNQLSPAGSDDNYSRISVSVVEMLSATQKIRVVVRANSAQVMSGKFFKMYKLGVFT